MQETYLTGLAEDPSVPFSREETPAWERGAEAAPGMAGPQVRRAETGAQVIDIQGLIREMEANPDARRRS